MLAGLHRLHGFAGVGPMNKIDRSKYGCHTACSPSEGEAVHFFDCFSGLLLLEPAFQGFLTSLNSFMRSGAVECTNIAIRDNLSAARIYLS